ncbi:hypothetical protein NXS98_06385 [Fontisphaera persica]|uniref:hypothetical protein n=1 Tax=Fontisphaera persica TaxID=2974023 RepID=UPI0024BFF125|nr:hypothetical protein [Fontisphaera persica]WCJ60753.1 hypothetical protein NXS98_06385 [Fontisphaera persica]
MGWAVLLWVGLGATNLPAREYYQDKEVWGRLQRVDDRRQILVVDRGPEKKIFRVQWNRKTQFRDAEKRIPVSSLREGQRVRIYYSDDQRRTGVKEPLANKVIVNPASTPQLRRYNQ